MLHLCRSSFKRSAGCSALAGIPLWTALHSLFEGAQERLFVLPALRFRTFHMHAGLAKLRGDDERITGFESSFHG